MIEFGPAAGVAACKALTASLGLRSAVSFDMGGTTAKASLIDGVRHLRPPSTRWAAE